MIVKVLAVIINFGDSLNSVTETYQMNLDVHYPDAYIDQNLALELKITWTQC